MRTKHLLLIAFLAFIGQASSTEWLCKEAASVKLGEGHYMACGVSTHSDLGQAREQALQAAIREFRTLCGVSDSCSEGDANFTPGRTDCSEKNGKFTCFRAVEVTYKKQKAHKNKSLIMGVHANYSKVKEYGLSGPGLNLEKKFGWVGLSSEISMLSNGKSIEKDQSEVTAVSYSLGAPLYLGAFYVKPEIGAIKVKVKEKVITLNEIGFGITETVESKEKQVYKGLGVGYNGTFNKQAGWKFEVNAKKFKEQILPGAILGLTFSW